MCQTISVFYIMHVFAWSEHYVSVEIIPLLISTTCAFSDCLQVEQEFRLDPMLEDHEGVMERMNTWNFQIFDLVDRTGGKTGRILSYVSITSSPVAVVVCVLIGWSAHS